MARPVALAKRPIWYFQMFDHASDYEGLTEPIEALIESGQIKQASLQRAQSISERTGKPIEVILNQMGALSDDVLARHYQVATGRPIAPVESLPTEIVGADLASPEFLRKHKLLPLSIQTRAFQLGMVTPTDENARAALEFAFRRRAEVSVLRAGDWQKAFSRLYEKKDEGIAFDLEADLNFFDSQDRDAPVVRKVATWISDAADLGASDIHFEARRESFEVKVRKDGALRLIATESAEAGLAIIARLKVLAGLDLGERRRPQDGRATIVVRGRRIDVRASLVPAIFGESCVLRLLDRPDAVLSLEELGHSEEAVSALKWAISQSQGLFLVAGPTGSGKTTTLYACIEALRDRDIKILSVEDPVEYQFDHVTQIQVSEKAGVGFADTLRAFLRHDPEVIFVGEIRDAETAKTAVQAAYTGHLVLASIHAIDTARVKNRLADMGVEPFKLDACLIGSMSQRLARKVCDACGQARELTEREQRPFLEEGLTAPANVVEPKGCLRCGDTGETGRLSVSEIRLGDRLVQSLRADALNKAAQGKISLRQALSAEAMD